MRRFWIAVVLVAIVGCSKSSVPPPIDRGKCEIVKYSADGKIEAQWCHWEGYAWFCDRYDCERKDPLPVEVQR